MNNQIVLYDNQKVDFLVFNSQSFSEEEKPLLEGEEVNISWENLENAKIICKYDVNLNSSRFSSITGEVEKYEISKRKNNEPTTTLVAYVDIEELQSEGNFYVLKDYNINNNTKYQYYISPLTTETIQATLSSKIITKWEDYILCPLVPDKTNKNRYNIGIGDDLEPIIWDFGLNCQEGEITFNQDKTVFTSFCSKPKISMGELDYKTSSLSCLLGEITYNNHYYESNVLLQKWEDMINKYQYYLFKNPKGDTYIVTLDKDIKKKYMNEVANYYIDNINGNEEVTNRPTTISFDYTEILCAKDIQIYI